MENEQEVSSAIVYEADKYSGKQSFVAPDVDFREEKSSFKQSYHAVGVAYTDSHALGLVFTIERLGGVRYTSAAANGHELETGRGAP